MKVLFVTDLHGSKWKYERLFEVAKSFKANIVINGGDMLPKDGDLFRQDEFITNYLDHHLSRFESIGIYYLCYLGNDDLRIFDGLFEETCDKYSFVVSLAQRRVEVFIGQVHPGTPEPRLEVRWAPWGVSAQPVVQPVGCPPPRFGAGEGCCHQR